MKFKCILLDNKGKILEVDLNKLVYVKELKERLRSLYRIYFFVEDS
jgi:hypothetical protein